VILDTLVKIDPRYPRVSDEARAAFADARVELIEGKPPTPAGPSAAAASGKGKSRKARGS
jgi:hypothetical protein